jgi:hypothetical protein
MSTPNPSSAVMLIETFGELYLDAKSKVVRPLTSDGSTAFGLRPCVYNGVEMFMTGTLKHPRFHSTHQIIRGLLSGADSFELPLPEEIAVPVFLVDEYDSLTPEAIDFVLEYLGGADKDYLAAKYGKGLARSVTAAIYAKGFAIYNPSSIELTINDMIESVAKEKYLIEKQHQNQRLSEPVSDVVVMQETATPAAYGVITDIPAKQYERLVRKAGGVVTHGERMKWPFAQMKIGQQVRIDPKVAKRAQAAVHVYANRMGKRFSTVTEPATGTLVVSRLEDKAHHLRSVIAQDAPNF